jgi:two-component system, cell cycle sensor histidine kinase and response regulator CckA
VESTPGAGSRFEIRLPLSDAQPAVRPSADPREPIAGSGRVLVVDDEPAVRRVATRMLRRIGYEPEEAQDGAMALARLERAPGAYAAVLLDLDMPGMDGRSCLRALRGFAPALPVVVSTGLPASELGETLSDEDVGLLPKPYELVQLSEAMAAALRRRA